MEEATELINCSRERRRHRVCADFSPRTKKSFTGLDPKAALDSILRKQRDGSGRDSKRIIFSGAGMIVSAGLSTFTGSIYSKAARKIKLKEGSKVFRYSFLDEHPEESFRFFSMLFNNHVKKAKTNNPSYRALERLAGRGQLLPH